MSQETLGAAYLGDIVRTYRFYKSLGDGAIAQVSDADLHVLVDPDANLCPRAAPLACHLDGLTIQPSCNPPRSYTWPCFSAIAGNAKL